MTTIINGTTDAITFPDSTVQNTSAIVSGKVPYTNLPVGSVLQVVNATYATSTTTTSSSFVSTGFTGTITPKFATSKILVLSRVPYRVFGGGSGGTYLGGCGWYRGGSPIQTITNFENGGGTIGDFRGFATQIVLDSPATTSAVTYTLFIASNTGTFYICDNIPASVIFMEIAA
jgi:hypothetical protein